MLVGVLATLFRMQDERIRLASAQDGREQRICGERGHSSTSRRHCARKGR